MSVKAFLVGVSCYPETKQTELPFCKNDLLELRAALHIGLNVPFENISICGMDGIVNIDVFKAKLEEARESLQDDDTFIFYFTGHAGHITDYGENCLALSDDFLRQQKLIDDIGSICAKNKLIIFDCCHAGDFQVENVTSFKIDDTIDEFFEHGYAVMASCSQDELSGFNADRKISRYTSYIIDALLWKSIIRKGKKSLEDINRLVCQFAKVENSKQPNIQQHPVFRPCIYGTILFDVEDYKAYQPANYFEECPKYIIYKVEDLSTNAKRIAVHVILKESCTEVELSQYALEIKEHLLLSDIYKNERSEARWKGKSVNIVFGYYGFDESDMMNHNYAFRTTWVDESQDKSHWYKINGNSNLVNDVLVTHQTSYEFIKKLHAENLMPKEEQIRRTREYTTRLINAAENLIAIYREYQNRSLTEAELVEQISPYIKTISDYYFAQNNMPLPPTEIKDWSDSNICLASTIHDMTLFYSPTQLKKRTADDRIAIMNNMISRYQENLEQLRNIEASLSF